MKRNCTPEIMPTEDNLCIKYWKSPWKKIQTDWLNDRQTDGRTDSQVSLTKDNQIKFNSFSFHTSWTWNFPFQLLTAWNKSGIRIRLHSRYFLIFLDYNLRRNIARLIMKVRFWIYYFISIDLLYPPSSETGILTRDASLSRNSTFMYIFTKTLKARSSFVKTFTNESENVLSTFCSQLLWQVQDVVKRQRLFAWSW